MNIKAKRELIQAANDLVKHGKSADAFERLCGAVGDLYSLEYNIDAKCIIVMADYQDMFGSDAKH